MGRELGTASSKSSKFKPSKRISPFSVPIHKYPSAVCVIAETDPPGNPLSLAQRSRMYWEIARSGSIAWAGRTEHTSATPVRNQWNSRRLTKAPLREVLEFLNNNLILALHGILFARDYKKREVKLLAPRSRHSRGEHVLQHRRCSSLPGRASDGLEGSASRLPMQRMRQSTGRLGKLNQVARDVKRLNYILGIFLTGLAPSADRKVQFTEMEFSRPLVVGIHIQNCCRLQMRSVAHYQNVVSIPKAPRKEDFSTRPAVAFLPDTKMQSSTRISPGVVSIVEIVHSSAIARDGANIPIVAAEMNLFGGCELRLTNAFDDLYQRHRTTLRWRRIHSRRRTVIWTDQQCGILPSEMGRGAPSRVRLNRNTSLIRPRLNPPGPTVRIDHDLLPWTSANNAT